MGHIPSSLVLQELLWDLFDREYHLDLVFQGLQCPLLFLWDLEDLGAQGLPEIQEVPDPLWKTRAHQNLIHLEDLLVQGFLLVHHFLSIL